MSLTSQDLKAIEELFAGSDERLKEYIKEKSDESDRNIANAFSLTYERFDNVDEIIEKLAAKSKNDSARLRYDIGDLQQIMGRIEATLQERATLKT